MLVFNEDTRVKIPATIQYIRLGYHYQSLKTDDIDIGFNTKIFVNRFKPALEKINGRKFSYDEIKEILVNIHNLIKNNDLGKEFYKWIIDPLDRVKLIDFANIENNDFAVVDELPFSVIKGTEEGSFRPDITVLINGMPLAFLEVKHCLLVKPGTDIDSIQKVYSHPQALMQCARYLDGHRKWQREPFLNTAMSARKVAEENDYTQAAIASPNCAGEYGLEIAEEGINSSSANTTRFVIVSSRRAFVKSAGKVSICFEIAHRAGSLYNALSNIMFNGLNMTKIESRPIAEHNWEFRFFVDFEGNLSDAGVRNALRGICEEANKFKLLGNY